jgi:hypothetical protein
MKLSRVTGADLRAAFRLRAAGVPRADLLHRITRATRSGHEQSRLTGTRDRRWIVSRLAATASVAAVLTGGLLAGDEFFDRIGPDLLGRVISLDLEIGEDIGDDDKVKDDVGGNDEDVVGDDDDRDGDVGEDDEGDGEDGEDDEGDGEDGEDDEGDGEDDEGDGDDG